MYSYIPQIQCSYPILYLNIQIPIYAIPPIYGISVYTHLPHIPHVHTIHTAYTTLPIHAICIHTPYSIYILRVYIPHIWNIGYIGCTEYPPNTPSCTGAYLGWYMYIPVNTGLKPLINHPKTTMCTKYGHPPCIPPCTGVHTYRGRWMYIYHPYTLHTHISTYTRWIIVVYTTCTCTS